ncbi:mycofactocin precursor MftA [Streptomyces sp. NBS 14/10]|nr:mycofactocin precursor MftA [Streptomyces sp. NBS 14/10]KAK1185385.1 mycofactocin precursor MftA [Streptomyces sp. NBS 14/10]
MAEMTNTQTHDLDEPNTPDDGQEPLADSLADSLIEDVSIDGMCGVY